MFDTIAGLPLHPLVVHAVVVLLPLAGIALALVVLRPRWRRAYAALAVAGVVAGAGAAVVARLSGLALAEHVGRPERHATLGTALTLIGILLAVVAVVWWLLQRGEDAESGSRTATRITGWLAVALVVPTLVLTVLAGHSGAESAWGGRLSQSQPEPAVPGAPEPSEAVYSMDEVATHDSAESCWVVVDGGVHDMTTWIPLHPGGPHRILPLCGTDGTAMFTGQHSRTPEAQQELASRRIGSLA